MIERGGRTRTGELARMASGRWGVLWRALGPTDSWSLIKSGRLVAQYVSKRYVGRFVADRGSRMG